VCIRRVQQQCRPPKEGHTVFIREVELEAGWKQVDLNKTHIVWDFRHDLVDKYFDEKRGRSWSKETHIQQTASESPLSSETPVLLGSTSEALREADVTASCGLTTLFKEDVRIEQPYCIHTDVEYYSSSNHTWVHGQIYDVPPLPLGAPVSGLRYDVVVGKTRQMRRLVPLNVLRTALLKNEPCEIMSNTMVEWSPAIVEEDPKTPTITGYTVRLLTGDVIRVAADRVRRRFKVGSPVEFFAGGLDGWVHAVVIEPSGNQVLLDEGKGADDGYATNQKYPHGGAEVLMSNFEQQGQPLIIANSAGEVQVRIQMWANVKVRLSKSSGDSKTLTVSAHLLRRSPGMSAVYDHDTVDFISM
jgi:hypothetical protein